MSKAEFDITVTLLKEQKVKPFHKDEVAVSPVDASCDLKSWLELVLLFKWRQATPRPSWKFSPKLPRD
jgi:hypothetical protein